MNSGNMGKSSKDAQGDERSAQIKRLKSINSNIKNAEVNVKQSEVPRPKVAATQKQQQQQQQQQQQLSQPKPKAIVLPKTGDSAKLSKLRIPTKAKAAVITELPTNRITQTSNKSEKKNTLLVDNTKKTTMKVQTPDNTDLICQTKKKDVGKSKNKNDENQLTIEQQKDNQQQQQQQQQQETTNGKTIENEKKSTNVVEIIKEVQIINEIQLEKEEKEETNGISDNKKNNGIVPENVEKNDKIKTDDDKLNNDESNKKNTNDDVNDDDMISLIDIPEDNIETTKSDEIVGSTTSESSPKKNDNNKLENNNELIIPQIKINQDEPMTNDDPSFISYDSAIMLKDVKIKLNDCLKDNNKLMDSVDENTSISESFKDLSFGRTLRTISGRSSLGRMKHVTIRQRQMTPNDSLFVNCSGMSTNQDEQLRFASEFSDSLTSGTSIDRKRKIDTDIEPSAKKIKKDETGGIFNTSLEYLKKLRRPLQVSTPNNQECKYNIDNKLDITEDASKIEIDETPESKRWCILM